MFCLIPSSGYVLNVIHSLVPMECSFLSTDGCGFVGVEAAGEDGGMVE